LFLVEKRGLILTTSGLKVGRHAQVMADVSSARDHDAAVTFHHVMSGEGFSHCILRIETAMVL
jgi:hypothetical protein